jgi:hypothetical protein
MESAGDGVSLLGVVQIVLLILKACNVIDWPWKIVLIPLWIELGVAAIVVIIFIISMIKWG